jgi:2-(3-amino-3-carboxypropyl)histidine synthase
LYDFEAERVAEEILKKKAKRVLLQFPEGLREQAFRVIRELSGRVEVEFLVSGDPCYGACDLPLWQAKSLGVDLIIHYGHSPMLGATNPPIVYVEAHAEIDIEEVVRRAIPLLGESRTIGLVSTVQHLDQLPNAEKILAGEGREALIGGRGKKATYPGQVLGCDYSCPLSIAEEAEVFLFIGGGEFHPLGLSLTTEKDVVTADPYTGRVGKITEGDRMKVAKRRWAAISAARQAKRFGIIVGLKVGQRKLLTAEGLKEKIEKRGGEAMLLCMEEITYENLANFTEVETFIETACPRIAIDGIEELRQPLITTEEALVMLGEIEWSRVWLETFGGIKAGTE